MNFSGDKYFQQILKKELADRLAKNPRYSLRAFAKSMKIDSAALSRILSGAKIPTPKISKKIFENIELTLSQKKSFLLSTAKAYQDGGINKKPRALSAILINKKFKLPERDLEAESFRVISDWYHYAILQLMKCQNFKADFAWIASELGIREIEAKLAVDRLVSIGVLKFENGKLIRIGDRLTSGDLRTTTLAHRKRIRQVTMKSMESLENDPIEQRNHTTLTIAIDPDKIPIAKEMIQDFMDQLGEVLQTKKKRVYELQVNLFPIQRNLKK